MITLSLYFLLFLNYMFPCSGFANNVPKIRILSGFTEDASPGEFPWIVPMDIKTKGKTRFCAGNIINNHWLITTADCIKGAKSISVYPGKVEISKDKNGSIAAKDWKTHEKFKKPLHNNIGLVKLKKPLEFNDFVKPVMLCNHELEDSSVITVLGWGLSLKSTFQNAGPQLRSLKVTSLSDEKCADYFTKGEIFKNEFCTTSGPSGNNCLGSKGAGALAFYDGEPQLVGVHSFVRPGCTKEYPMGFIRVFNFIDWIQNITQS